MQQMFAPVSRNETITLVVAMTNFKGWSLSQLDVKSTFIKRSGIYVKNQS